MTTKRFEACKWKKRKLRYYLLNAETKTCIAVPSPKRYIRNHPDMESVVCHMAKIVQKRLEKTIKLISG